MGSRRPAGVFLLHLAAPGQQAGKAHPPPFSCQLDLLAVAIRAPVPRGDTAEQVKYPIGTVAFYGPDDKTTTKIAAASIVSANAEPMTKR